MYRYYARAGRTDYADLLLHLWCVDSEHPRRLNGKPTSLSGHPALLWHRNIWPLYFVSKVFFIRTLVGIIDFKQGDSGFLINHKSMLYVTNGRFILVVVLMNTNPTSCLLNYFRSRLKPPVPTISYMLHEAQRFNKVITIRTYTHSDLAMRQARACVLRAEAATHTEQSTEPPCCVRQTVRQQCMQPAREAVSEGSSTRYIVGKTATMTKTKRE